MVQSKAVLGLFMAALAVSAARSAQADTTVPYQISVSKVCPTTASCELLFPVTAANRRVDIEHINCSASTSADELSYVSLQILPQNVLIYPTVTWHRLTGVSHFYVLSEATSAFVPAGNQLRALGNTLTTSGTLFLTCTLSGKLVFLS